jgi:hypothetical protein
MSLATRLNRLTPGLTGKQRALLIIRAHLDDREPDRELLANVPSDQRREYDYYIALLYTSNSTLGTLLRSLTWIVDALERDSEQYAMIANAARLVEEAFEATPDIEEVRRWKKSSNLTLPLFLRGLERDVRASGLQRLLMLWQELRGLEMLWAEIAGECDGEDLRHPDLIAEAALLRTRLLDLIQAVSPKHAKKPPDPSEEALAGVRRHVDEAMRMMGFREPPE